MLPRNRNQRKASGSHRPGPDELADGVVVAREEQLAGEEAHLLVLGPGIAFGADCLLQGTDRSWLTIPNSWAIKLAPVCCEASVRLAVDFRQEHRCHAVLKMLLYS